PLPFSKRSSAKLSRRSIDLPWPRSISRGVDIADKPRTIAPAGPLTIRTTRTSVDTSFHFHQTFHFTRESQPFQRPLSLLPEQFFHRGFFRPRESDSCVEPPSLLCSPCCPPSPGPTPR